MINRILFWFLTRLYRVDPKMCSLDNWRVAHPYEGISQELGFCPLIFKETCQNNTRYVNSKIQLESLGISNLIFLGRGKVFLVPQLNETYFKQKEIKNLDDLKHLSDFDKKKIESMAIDSIPYTLFKHYIENDPHILVKKFPTKLLVKLFKRQIENQRKNLKNNKDENSINKCTLSNAIRSDLSQSDTYINSIFKFYENHLSKDPD